MLCTRDTERRSTPTSGPGSDGIGSTKFSLPGLSRGGAQRLDQARARASVGGIRMDGWMDEV